MAARIYRVLFLCTGNSARSVMAEAILNRIGKGRFQAFSAGSHPKGEINPHTLALLKQLNHSTDKLRSKDWSEFSGRTAPPLDFVFTVCDNAAGEVCPVWPGQPVSAHWGVDDPARYMDEPDKARSVIREVFVILQKRIQLFLSLPLEKLDRMALQSATRDIGKKT